MIKYRIIPKMYVTLLTHFFVNVANDIGKDITFDERSHPSISTAQHTV